MSNYRPGLWTILAIVLMAAPNTGWGQTGSLNNWVEACSVTDPDLLQLLDNEALLVGTYALTNNWNGTYALAHVPYTSPGWNTSNMVLCPSSKFYGQPEVDGLPFRSAVQVGPDLVLTAYHASTIGSPTDPLLLAAVFGLHYVNSGGNCVAPDFDHIPAANVFFVREVVADGQNGATDPVADFLLLRLDCNANGTYPRIRRSGQGRGENLPAYGGDRITSIGHPERLATKVDLGGTLYAYSNGSTYTGPQVKNSHLVDGNSGGMIYNRDERFIETLARFPVWTITYICPPPGSEGCCTMAHVDNHGQTHEWSLAYFSQYIPAFELLISPLDTIVHNCQAGSCTNLTTNRVIMAPSTAAGNIDYEIVGPSGTAPQLSLSVGSGEGTLQPGEHIDVQETINISGAACGQTYERTYSVIDATHGFTDVIRHIFNIQC